MQSCDSPHSVLTPVSAESPSSGVVTFPTTPSTCPPELQPSVDIQPLQGDSSTVGQNVSAAKTTTTTPVKLEATDAMASPHSIHSAGDPATPIEPLRSPIPTVAEAPPPPSPALTPSEPIETGPACPATNDVMPAPDAVPEVKPVPKPETPTSVSSRSSSARKVPPSPTKRDVRPPVKAASAVAPVADSTAFPSPSSPLPVPAKRPVKLDLSPSAYQQASPSTMSSVTPTPSTSTVQSNMTTPRSFCQDQLAADDPGTSSSYGSIKTPGSPASAGGSYLRSHQRRTATQRHDISGDGSTSPAYHHDRKSRSVSPTSQSDSYRSSTPSTLRTSTCQGSRGRSPAHSALSPEPPSSVEWSRPTSPYRMRAFSPRHVTEYKHCVAPEPEDVPASRRQRENTHSKLFGAKEPDSPRTAAVASAAAAGGLNPMLARRSVENTQATLFGPPDPHRKSSRAHPDTHQSLFGPPPAPHAQRRSRSCFHDTADLLHHDPSAGGPSEQAMQAVRGRYALRHQDTGTKLFGDAAPVRSLPSATPRPYRDHDIFLVGEAVASNSSSITSTVSHADSIPLQ